jgi:hypothetical protein
MGIHDVLEACDDSLESRLLIALLIRDEEVMTTSKTLHDLTYEEFPPLNLHVSRHSFMVFLLDALEIIKFSRILKHIKLRLKVSELLEVNALLDEDSCHAN